MVKSLEDLVARPADGIIFTPYWATAARGLSLAKDANIPVILTDVYADFQPQSSRFPNYLAFVGPSDEDAGKQMAEALFAAMTPDANGKKVIGVVNGTAGTSVAIDRRKGLEDALKVAPGSHGGRRGRRQLRSRHIADGVRIPLSGASRHQGRVGGQRRHGDRRDDCAEERGQAAGQGRARRRHGPQPGERASGEERRSVVRHRRALAAGRLRARCCSSTIIKGKPVPKDQDNVKLKLLPLTKDTVAQFEADFPGGVPPYDFKAHSRVYTPDAAAGFVRAEVQQVTPRSCARVSGAGAGATAIS